MSAHFIEEKGFRINIIYVLYLPKQKLNKLKQPNLRNIISYPIVGFFEYLFMFWLHRHVKYERITKISKKRYELAGTYLNESFITRLGSLLSTQSSSLLPSLNFLKLGIKSVGCHLLERHSSSEIVPIPLLCVLWCLRQKTLPARDFFPLKLRKILFCLNSHLFAVQYAYRQYL